MDRKTVIIKLTGNVIKTDERQEASRLVDLASQIKQLTHSLNIGIVMGGGNFFRGARQSADLGIAEETGHYVGMLATMMNGLIIQDHLTRMGVGTTLFSAMPCETVGLPISSQNIQKARAKKHCLIFSGGTGNPFFSTDTTSVIRALQMGATEIWKGTNVEGIYTQDPHKDSEAELIKTLSYQEALKKNIEVMDATAFTLAYAHHLTIRVFNIFTDNALIIAANDGSYGSTIDQV